VSAASGVRWAIPEEVAAYNAERDKHLIEALERVLHGPGVSSFNRLDVFLALTRPVQFDIKRATVFWPVFFATWPHCDGTIRLSEILLSRMLWYTYEGYACDGVPPAAGTGFLPEEDKAFFAGLPDPVPVFRGCSREHVESLCWTTDRKIAEKFARITRVRVPRPVVASASIAKANVFGVCTCRKESDVLLDPAGLVGVKRHKLLPSAA
jgi:hypothetical protein